MNEKVKDLMYIFLVLLGFILISFGFFSYETVIDVGSKLISNIWQDFINNFYRIILVLFGFIILLIGMYKVGMFDIIEPPSLDK